MRKLLLLILLLLASSATAQISPFGFSGTGVWAMDFDGSTEYLSCTPSLRLTGEYSLYDNFSDGNYDGWTVSSGAYSVVNSVPLSGGTKSLKCMNPGIISIPCNQAYGSWEFDLYSANVSVNTTRMRYISNVNSIGAESGYSFAFSATSVTSSRITAGTATSLLVKSSLYVTSNIWYRCKVTRNTNGQFYVYVKGGLFGTDYVLVSVTGGGGTNPVTDNTYTSSNYFVLDLDANDMIANIVCQQGEGSLDLNSYERIYHADNRNMTKTGGYSWNGNGTHSIDTTSTDKRTETYSSKIISTDVGDSTTNFVNLPNAGFDTLKTDANGIYEKYTLELWCKSKALSRVIIKVGNQVKTSDTISTVAFEKVVFNFQSNSLVSNQPIQIYLNQADTVFIDDVSLTKSYDFMINAIIKTSVTDASNRTILDLGNDVGTKARMYLLRTSSTNTLTIGYKDEVNDLTSTSGKVIADNNWNLVNYRIAKKDSLKASVNAGTEYIANANMIGKTTFFNFSIGYKIPITTSLTFWQNYLGHIQIVKFTDISQSNVNSTTLTTAYNRGKLLQGEWTGGSPIEVAFYDWKGATTNEILSDKSSMGNNLTGTNIDINDRIKVKGKFK